MKLVENLQKLPLEKRKIIFYVLLAIVAIFLLICFLIATKYHLKNLKIEELKQNIQLPSTTNIFNFQPSPSNNTPSPSNNFPTNPQNL